MDARRSEFQKFVDNRRSDLKSEKKKKLTSAKIAFQSFVTSYFENAWNKWIDGDKAYERWNDSFQVFLNTFKWSDETQLPQECIDFLPTAKQETLWVEQVTYTLTRGFMICSRPIPLLLYSHVFGRKSNSGFKMLRNFYSQPSRLD